MQDDDKDSDGVSEIEEDQDSNRCQVGNYQSTSSSWKSGNTRWANRRGGTGEKDSNNKCRDITWGYLVYNSRYGEKYCEARSKMAASSDSKMVTIFVAAVVLGIAVCIGVSIAWKVTSKRATAARTVEDGVTQRNLKDDEVKDNKVKSIIDDSDIEPSKSKHFASATFVYLTCFTLVY